MAFYFGKGSERRLEGVHPALVAVVRRAITLTRVDFTVLEGVRSLEVQKKYVARGVSRTLDSRHLIDPDTGFGNAVDIAPIRNGSVLWGELGAFRDVAEAMWEARRESGVILRHGADFNFTGKQDGQLIDWPHWELPKPEMYTAAMSAIERFYS